MGRRATGLMTWTVGIALLVTFAPGAGGGNVRPAGLRSAVELLSKAARPARTQRAAAFSVESPP
jgi:hypothetical protein